AGCAGASLGDGFFAAAFLAVVLAGVFFAVVFLAAFLAVVFFATAFFAGCLGCSSVTDSSCRCCGTAWGASATVSAGAEVSTSSAGSADGTSVTSAAGWASGVLDAGTSGKLPCALANQFSSTLSCSKRSWRPAICAVTSPCSWRLAARSAAYCCAYLFWMGVDRK